MYYVYVLENQDDKSFYIGFTIDLRRRISEHNDGRGGRTTSLKKHWKIIYFEGYLNKSDALGREKFLKGGSGRKYLNKQLRHYFSF
ncbi:MAG: GIY-YIG nuclease family protein [bacterium]|jgi:putative endonuclease|nr:GIY-YIG nuclease family protein [bacterium]